MLNRRKEILKGMLVQSFSNILAGRFQNVRKRRIIQLFVVMLMFFAPYQIQCQWIPMINGLPNQTPNAFAVSGINIFVGLNSSAVYLTTNNGTSWTNASYGLPSNSSIYSFAVSGNNIFAATGSYVFLTTNNGTNWTNITSNLTHAVTVLAASGNNIFAGTDAQSGGLSLTTNYGANWDIVTTGLTNLNVHDLAVNGNEIIAGTFDGVFMTTNNGANWAVHNGVGLTHHDVRHFAVSGNIIFAVSIYNQTSEVFVTSNNGSLWTSVLTNHNVEALGVSGNNVFAGTNAAGVFLTTNNGTSWSNVELLNSAFDCFAVSGNYIFAGGYSGGSNYVWRRPINEMLGINNILTEVPSDFGLSQNYPNPFNPSTKFKIQISKLSDTRVTVYDELGKEITTLVNQKLQPGTYELNWDAANYPSGVYFYKIISGGFTQTKKMMLIK